jgi:SAM-dependent methyltransferase
VQTIDNTRRFSDRVDFYVRARPTYPTAVLDFCRDPLGLRADFSVADVGSGTGLLTELFLGNGNSVFAVEPNDEMRRAAEERLGHFPGFHSVAATAEATGLADDSLRFVLAGQAFHWFDPPRARAEFRRILVPGGWVVLVWNERRTLPGNFMAEYGAITAEFRTDAKAAGHSAITAPGSTVLKEFFAPGGYATATFDHSQELDLPGLQDRLNSSSQMPLPGQPRHGELIAKVEKAFARHAVGGRVRLDYDTRVYYGRLDPIPCSSR